MLRRATQADSYIKGGDFLVQREAPVFVRPGILSRVNYYKVNWPEATLAWRPYHAIWYDITRYDVMNCDVR